MAIYMRGQDASVVAAGRPALLQSKWDKPLARIRYNFERRSPHVQENPESLHVPGKGRYSSASPSGTHPCLNSWYSRQNAFERRRRRRLVAEFVNHYDRVRLHSAIAYIAPADKLAGPALAIWAARKHKLATADARRRAKDQGKGNGPATVLSNTLRRPQRKIGKRGDTTQRRPRAKTGKGGTKPPHGHSGIGSKAINPFTNLVSVYYLSERDRLSHAR